MSKNLSRVLGIVESIFDLRLENPPGSEIAFFVYFFEWPDSVEKTSKKPEYLKAADEILIKFDIMEPARRIF